MRTYFKLVVILSVIVSRPSWGSPFEYQISRAVLTCKMALSRNSSPDEIVRYIPSLLLKKELLNKFTWKGAPPSGDLNFVGILKKKNMTVILDLKRNKRATIIAGGGFRLRIFMPVKFTPQIRFLLKAFQNRPHQILIGEELEPSLSKFEAAPHIFEFSSHITSVADAIEKMHGEGDSEDVLRRILGDEVLFEAMHAQEMSAHERQAIFNEFFDFVQAVSML